MSSPSRARPGQTRLAAILFAFGLGACSYDAQVTGMTVQVTPSTLIDESSPLYQATEVQSVSGSSDAVGLLETSLLNDEDFAEALRLSLANHVMLAGANPRYGLTATIVEIDQPLIAASMDVTLTARYVMRELATGRVVFDEQIAAPYTAAFSEAFLGAERLRTAYEGAARASITSFLVSVIRKARPENERLLSDGGVQFDGVFLAAADAQR